MSFKEIAIWLVVFIVGSLIVTFLISPTSFDSFKSNIGSIIPTKSEVSLNSASIANNPSLANCQNEIGEKTRIAEEKSPVSLDISIREYKSFNNSLSALEYLEEWKLMGNELFILGNQYYEPNIDLNKEEDLDKIVEYDDIIVFLARFEYSREGDSVKILKPIICLDGKLSPESKTRFDFSIYG